MMKLTYLPSEINLRGGTPYCNGIIMIRIAICDDDNLVIEQITGYLKQMVTEVAGTQQLEIIKFDRGTKLLENYPENLDILFLDIQMPDMNGIETARNIRKKDTCVAIVFITNYVKYAVEGYSVQAYNYLLKPIQ